MGATITFKRPDGGEAQGYLANASRGDAAGLVVIQEWWGLSEQIKAMVDRFALAGFDALAPDLFKGVVVPYHDADAASKEMMSLDFMDATSQTVRGAAQYLKRNGAKVGITGFCMGGAIAVIARGAYSGVRGRSHVLWLAAGRRGEARRRQDSAAGPFRQPRRLCHARGGRRLRKRAPGGGQGLRVLPLRSRSRLRQRAAGVRARPARLRTRLGARDQFFRMHHLR